MPSNPVRLAARAVIIHKQRLLLVNAWPKGRSTLLCAPGGGVEPGASLPDNLAREVQEETGLTVRVGLPCLVNEFHDPRSGFHQVELFFRCSILGDANIPDNWQDPEKIVSHHAWVRREDMSGLNVKPSSLADIAFDPATPLRYDPLEQIVM
ncbi:NUDIX domain-containing protein [Roseobacter sp. YSTF-M11]|uniref:NUDIX domain-containing protein n=1 Tax=Roseobacter insulae TaxID=2859783 RepID=A0A9X1FZK3_9RHOB|nr:NUDIX domain-containing protein [Roseobacter insulae]MBW4710619.1 NUDIX domain-containing protein [Roseobacter insulae]